MSTATTDIPTDAARPETGEAERTTVYYDGSCPICRTEIAFMRRRDTGGRVEFADIAADPTVLPPELPADRAMARFHVRGADGTLREGAAGFAAMWAELPALRPLAWLARVPGVLPVLERLYRAFLRVRPRLQPLAERWERRRS